MQRDIVFRTAGATDERDGALVGAGQQSTMDNPGAGSSKGSDAARARERIKGAILELSGELGYRGLRLEPLLVRSGCEAGDFHHEFSDLGECFEIAYEEQAEALCRQMLGAAHGRGEWRAGTEAALAVVLRFASARPSVAKALVREVHVAGGAALAKHEEVLERLALAVGGGGCEPPTDQLASVPRAPSFIVGAVEGVIAGHLDRGEPDDLEAVAPELMYLIVASFLGRDAT